jgi:hypothetical protein
MRCFQTNVVCSIHTFRLMGDPVILLSRTLADMGSVSSATSSVKRQLTIPVMLPRQVLSSNRSRDIQGAGRWPIPLVSRVPPNACISPRTGASLAWVFEIGPDVDLSYFRRAITGRSRDLVISAWPSSQMGEGTVQKRRLFAEYFHSAPPLFQMRISPQELTHSLCRSSVSSVHPVVLVVLHRRIP